MLHRSGSCVALLRSIHGFIQVVSLQCFMAIPSHPTCCTGEGCRAVRGIPVSHSGAARTSWRRTSTWGFAANSSHSCLKATARTLETHPRACLGGFLHEIGSDERVSAGVFLYFQHGFSTVDFAETMLNGPCFSNPEPRSDCFRGQVLVATVNFPFVATENSKETPKKAATPVGRKQKAGFRPCPRCATQGRFLCSTTV